MQAVCNLILKIKDTLQGLSSEHVETAHVLNKLDALNVSSETAFSWQPAEPVHKAALEQAIAGMAGTLAPLSNTLQLAMDDLQWRVDRGTYYDGNADVGEGYLNGNMHCELIGPDGSSFHDDDFTLGLFLLTPRVLYRDHAHEAPELYLTLTEPSGWRFEDDVWEDYTAGSVIWNPSNAVHATRVYDHSFLSIYSWTRDVRSKCRVIPRDDWSVVETSLRERT